MNSFTCPKCDMVAIVAFVKDDPNLVGFKATGVQCQFCGWTNYDKVSRRVDLTCGCGKQMGYKFHHQDEMETPDGKAKFTATVVCQGCSAKHLESNNPRPVLVRYDVFCEGGCGRIIAWNDHWERVVLGVTGKLQSGRCPYCAR